MSHKRVTHKIHSCSKTHLDLEGC